MRWTKKTAIAAMVFALVAVLMFTVSYFTSNGREEGSVRGWVTSIFHVMSADDALGVERLEVSDRRSFDLDGVEAIRIVSKQADLVLRGSSTEKLEASYSGSVLWRSSGEPAPEILEIRTEQKGGTLELSVGVDQSFFGDRYSSEAILAVAVPSPFEGKIEMVSVSGDVEVEEAKGRKISMNSVSGDVTSRGSGVPLGVHSVSGDVHLDFYDDDAPVNVETISGDVEVRFSKDAGGSLEVETVSGDIDSVFLLKMKGGGRNEAKGVVKEGRRPVSVATVSGDVRITSFEGSTP